MTSEIKLAAICTAGLVAVSGMIFAEKVLEMRKAERIEMTNANNAIEKAKLEATYPPEYWLAKKAAEEANVEEEKAKIEATKQLELDKRDREDAEKAARREYEKNAPAEYWEQKRIAEEEKTKRDRARLQFEAEQEAARQHRQAIAEGAKVVDRALKNNFGYSTGYFGI